MTRIAAAIFWGGVWLLFWAVALPLVAYNHIRQWCAR